MNLKCLIPSDIIQEKKKGYEKMIVKQLTLTSKGLGQIEIPELPRGENVEAITAYTIEQIGEILFNSIIPIRDRFLFDFEKELVYPPEGEVVELDVIYLMILMEKILCKLT